MGDATMWRARAIQLSVLDRVLKAQPCKTSASGGSVMSAPTAEELTSTPAAVFRQITIDSTCLASVFRYFSSDF